MRTNSVYWNTVGALLARAPSQSPGTSTACHGSLNTCMVRTWLTAAILGLIKVRDEHPEQGGEGG